MSGLIIRPLQQGDIPALARMEERIFSTPWTEKAFGELLTRPYCFYLTAEQNGIPIGCAGMICLGCEGDIDKVMVDEDRRRQGIADALLGGLITGGIRQGITEFTLEVRAGNIPAIRLYEKHGFKQEGIRPRFYEKPVEDALILWRRESPDI